MKTIKKLMTGLAITVALVAMAGAPAVAGETYHERMNAKVAEAGWEQTTDSVTTQVWVYVKQDKTGLYLEYMKGVRYWDENKIVGTEGRGDSGVFTVKNPLKSASLTATVPVTTCTWDLVSSSGPTCEEPSTVQLSVQWTGTGERSVTAYAGGGHARMVVRMADIHAVIGSDSYGPNTQNTGLILTTKYVFNTR